MRKIVLITLVGFFGMTSGKSADARLITRTYEVPPTFETWMSTNEKEALFTNAYFHLTQIGQSPKRSAQQILSEAGVSFEGGATATYNAEDSKLSVTNTEAELYRVETFVQSLIESVPRLINLTIREFVFEKQRPPFESSTGNGSFSVPELLITPESTLRDSPDQNTLISYESFFQKLSRPIEPTEENDTVYAFRGIYKDPTAEVAYRYLKAIPEATLIEIGSATTRNAAPTILEGKNRRFGVVPIHNEAEKKITLNLFISPIGKPLPKEQTTGVPAVRVTLRDCDCAAVTESDQKGVHRIIFIRAELVDPAGMPIKAADSGKTE